LFVAGFASLAHSLGVGSRGTILPWKRKPGQRWRRRRAGGWLRRRHAGALEQAPSDRREPVFDLTFGSAYRDAENALAEQLVECEADFVLSTDLQSRAIAERFAPRRLGR
jgi:hypothetical protein